MTKEYIEFKKERDLGAIISDAFKFIRLEGKEFFLTILKISAIPILITVASLVFILFSFSSFSFFYEDTPFDSAGFGLSVFIMMIAYLVTIVQVNLSGMYYIKSYIDHRGEIRYEEIKSNVYDKFWSFLGMGILIGLIFVASMLFCFLPLIYTYPVLSLTASIFVFESISATDAIGKSFNFINGHFWETLGVVIVVAILVTILGYIFQIPAFIYQMIHAGIGLGYEDPTEIGNLYRDPIYLILYIVSIVGNLMFYSITLITNVFLYFDINEQKNLTGTIEKIDSLGQ